MRYLSWLGITLGRWLDEHQRLTFITLFALNVAASAMNVVTATTSLAKYLTHPRDDLLLLIVGTVNLIVAGYLAWMAVRLVRLRRDELLRRERLAEAQVLYDNLIRHAAKKQH